MAQLKQLITDVPALVDSLGSLKAQIAALTRKETDIKAQLIQAAHDMGVKELNGSSFRATVSEFVRESLDMDAVRAKLSPQFVAAHTRETLVTTVRVMAQVRDI